MGHDFFKNLVKAGFKFVINLVRSVILSLLLNPLVWWIWGLIGPKSAVNILKRTVNNKSYLLYCVGSFWYLFDCLIIKLLPWNSKIYFFEAFPKVKMSDKQQVRAYCERRLKKEKLSEDAKLMVWNLSRRYWKDFADGKLSSAQFSNVLYSNEYDVLRTHLEAQTPSKDKMKLLLDAAVARYDCSFIDIMKDAILKYGLHSDLVKMVFTAEYYEKIRKDVKAALDLYSEMELVIATGKDMDKWSKFLIHCMPKSVSVPAQRLFTQQQFDIYIKKYKPFNEKVLLEWMSDNEKREWVLDYVRARICSSEASEAVNALIKADKWWREKLYL